jgi:hypothetical protein
MRALPSKLNRPATMATIPAFRVEVKDVPMLASHQDKNGLFN